MGNPGWIIDRDLLGAWDAQPNGDAASDVGTVGPGSFTGDSASLDIPFRLYDDDGGLYYEGRMNADALDAYGEGWGNPLDDFGMPNAGCTELQYLDRGEWMTL